MAMQKRIRKWLNKNRELLWHLLEGKRCFFCDGYLIPENDVSAVNFGTAQAPPIEFPITIHHKDGRCRNHVKSNRALAHQRCHKQHHAKEIRPVDFKKAA
jgi:hypothetical protein